MNLLGAILLLVLSAGIGSAIGFGIYHHLDGVWHRQKVEAAKQAARHIAAAAEHERTCRSLGAALSAAEAIEGNGDPQVGMVLLGSAKYTSYVAGCLSNPVEVDQGGIDRRCQEAQAEDPVSIGGDQYGNQIRVPNPDYNPKLVSACLSWDQAEVAFEEVP